MIFYFQREFKIKKDKLLKLCLLLMHVIEYYFNEIWNLVYNISNNGIYDQCISNNVYSFFYYYKILIF
jgi:hypothetical protein